MNQPFFITFEGIDGAGKSTHIDALAAAFRAAGRSVTLTREPGGTPLAEKLRAIVLGDPMDALTEALLIFAARRDHLQQVIEPALAKGDVVICDRFTDATFAYQGGGRGFDLEILSTLERWVQQTSVAHDLATDIAAARLAGTRVPDRFEAQPVAFFEQVRAGYARRMALDPDRFARIDAGQGREAVWASVRAAIPSGYLTS